MKQLICLFGVIILFLSCNSVTKKEYLSGINESPQTEWGKVFTEVYNLPGDSIKPMEEAVKARHNYSIYDMIDDKGNFEWKYSDYDPFTTRHLMCKGIMLTDTLMYRLVDNLLCLRDCYDGSLQAVYDWLWHEEMLKEIDTYLTTTYPKKKKFDIGDYEQVILSMVNYVSPLLDGNDAEMGQASQVEHYAKSLLLIGEYKEAVRNCEHSPKMARTYMEDYRLWIQVFYELSALYRPETHASEWDMAYHCCGAEMMDFRLDFLIEEVVNLWSGTSIDEKEKSVSHFKFDKNHSALLKWYDMRNSVKDKENDFWYSNMTNKIVKEYFRKENSLAPLL